MQLSILALLPLLAPSLTYDIAIGDFSWVSFPDNDLDGSFAWSLDDPCGTMTLLTQPGLGGPCTHSFQINDDQNIQLAGCGEGMPWINKDGQWWKTCRDDTSANLACEGGLYHGSGHSTWICS